MYLHKYAHSQFFCAHYENQTRVDNILFHSGGGGGGSIHHNRHTLSLRYSRNLSVLFNTSASAYIFFGPCTGLRC